MYLHKYAHWLALSTQRKHQQPIFPWNASFCIFLVFSRLCFAYQTCTTQITNMTLVHKPPVHWTRTLTFALKAFRWPVSTNYLFISFLILFLLDCICKLRWRSDKMVLWTIAQRNGPSQTSMMRFTMFYLEQGRLHPCGRYFDMYHLPKQCCRPCTPFHGTDISWWLWPLSPGRVPCHEAKMIQEWFLSASASQFTGLRGSAANILEPDTTAHLHRVNTSTGQSCFDSKCGTNRILMLNLHHNAMPDWFMICSCEISGQ